MMSAFEHTDAVLIDKLQALFRIGPDNPISLRAIWPYDKRPARNPIFTARQYPDVRQRWRAALGSGLKLNDAGFNVYTIMNPVRPDFSSGAVSGPDIICRRLLLIDLDRTETGKQTETGKRPATEEEIAHASAVADRIEGWMRANDEVPAARVMSGNGIHLYFRLDDLPNDTHSDQICRQFLLNLADEFNTPTIKIDTGVWDAPRITKLPGTFARKGQETPERPYRRAMFL